MLWESSVRALGKGARSLPGGPPLGPAARGPLWRAHGTARRCRCSVPALPLLCPGAAAALSRRCGRNAAPPLPQPGPAPPPSRDGPSLRPPRAAARREGRGGGREARPRQPAGEYRGQPEPPPVAAAGAAEGGGQRCPRWGLLPRPRTALAEGGPAAASGAVPPVRAASGARGSGAGPCAGAAPPMGSAAVGGGPRVLRALTGCLLGALVLSTLLGNALVCLAVLRFRHLRNKVTNWFVLSLAISDLCVALLVMPWKAVTEVAGGSWLFGSHFCDTWVAFDIMCSTASVLHLCIISLDRYWAIASPFRYERRMTRHLACAMIATAWTLSILISFIPVQLHWHKAMDRRDLGSWLPGTPRCDVRLNRTYAITSSLISFYIPVAVMIITYTRIYRIAQAQICRISTLERAGGQWPAHGKEPTSSLRSSLHKETKVLQTLSIIMGVFVCCWLPFFLLNCLLPFCQPNLDEDAEGQPPCVGQTTFNVFVWFGWANSSVNPVIYAFNADFRRAFSNLLGCRCCCCGTPRSPVERVNFSNELVSYHQDTTCQKEGAVPVSVPPAAITAWVQPMPHAISLQGEDSTEEKSMEKRVVTSQTQTVPGSSPNSCQVPAILQLN
ncbi:D(1)-like dopamine receptor [Corvus kubaryi]|uniref:D(1)-like dopamine receptor n=1 Tax=Corvus kubaryi TaxID=68294 RepID=UPI001C04D045|nr:D(1)-like dopamine receptor [Corvus kubaryi]